MPCGRLPIKNSGGLYTNGLSYISFPYLETTVTYILHYGILSQITAAIPGKIEMIQPGRVISMVADGLCRYKLNIMKSAMKIIATAVAYSHLAL